MPTVPPTAYLQQVHQPRTGSALAAIIGRVIGGSSSTAPATGNWRFVGGMILMGLGVVLAFCMQP